MPWREVSLMSQREEFVTLAMDPDRNFRELCRRWGISPPTGYKWVHRYAEVGRAGLADRSRRPQRSPRRTATAMEEAVCAVRQEHPAWGGRKIRAVLAAAGVDAVPAPATITGILRRHGLLVPERPAPHAWQRFEAPEPNQLWQMDFKGHFPAGDGRCHPLTVLDDHSRFNLCLAACADERGETVKDHLTAAFQRYGLPERLLVDNGAPWGNDVVHRHTPLTAWLIRLDIRVSHGRPYHAQTQGKEERFHRTLKVEVIQSQPVWRHLAEVQLAFDAWRPVYNLQRPHEALGMQPPAARYRPSPRPFPRALPPIEYAPGDVVRRVQQKGVISYRGHDYLIGKAFTGQPVALRPASQDGVIDVYFCHQRVVSLDLRSPFP